MHYHLLPGSELRLSALCYGLGGFGSKVKGSAMERLFAAFREAGGTFFDTAHCYAFWVEEGAGCSERALGECVRRFGGRDQVVIATKGGHPDGGPRYPRPDRYLAPELLVADVADSLERLAIDTIDLYYLHRDDPRVPVAEILDALNCEIDRGRLHALGASNWSVSRIEEANRWARENGRAGFVASQPQWSLGVPNWRPGPEPTVRFVTDEDAGWYSAHEVAVVPYSSTSNGYFATDGSRGSDFQNETNESRLRRAQHLARERRCTPGQIALAYLMSQPARVIPIVGTTDEAHLQDALGASQIQLTFDELNWLRDGGPTPLPEH
jgi:1-deoxyxylulose-5-phosphate synthase